MKLPSVDIRDGLTFGGVLLVSLGGWLWRPAAGLVLGGVLLFYLGALHPLIFSRLGRQ